jgi:hypothetical protein
VILTGGGLTVIVTVVDFDCGVASVSLAVTVAVAVCAVVGVPLIVSVPPLALAVSPAGSPVTVPQV